MPRIDFYVLSDQKENGRAALACRLAEKAYGLGHTVYLFTASETGAVALDDLLWTFRQDSFVPHERFPLVGEEDSPVLVGTAAPATVEAHVLINLSDTLPEGFERYQRVVELVDQHPEVLTRSRERFRQYRDQGYPVETHKL